MHNVHGGTSWLKSEPGPPDLGSVCITRISSPTYTFKQVSNLRPISNRPPFGTRIHLNQRHPMNRTILVFALCSLAAAQPDRTPLVDRVASTGFVQLEANSFQKLSPKERELAYWLSQASIAIDPILYDQLSRFGLRQKHLLELVVAQPAAPAKIVAFTKLFWANRGNHNENTAQKFLPEFSFGELKEAARAAYHRGGSAWYADERT